MNCRDLLVNILYPAHDYTVACIPADHLCINMSNTEYFGNTINMAIDLLSLRSGNNKSNGASCPLSWAQRLAVVLKATNRMSETIKQIKVEIQTVGCCDRCYLFSCHVSLHLFNWAWILGHWITRACLVFTMYRFKFSKAELLETWGLLPSACLLIIYPSRYSLKHPSIALN